MVYKIISGKYGVFVEALILTILIFLFGFSIGYFIEYGRLNNIVDDFKQQEVQSFDIRLQNDYLSSADNISCDFATEQNFKVADQIYDTGLLLERYEEANQITDRLK